MPSRSKQSRRVPRALATEIAASVGTAAEGGGRDDRADPGDGRRESAVGRRAYPGRAAQAWCPRRQDHGPAAHAQRPPAASRRPDLGHLPAQSCTRHVGLRLLRHRARLAAHRPRRRDALPDRRVGRPAATRGDAFGERPGYLSRDNDSKYGPTFSRVAKVGGITELRTPYRAPPAASGASASATCWPWDGGTCCACCANTGATSISTGPSRACACRSPTPQRE